MGATVTIELSGAFGALTAHRQLSVEGDNLSEVLEDLDRAIPGVLGRILNKEGSVRSYVIIYRNDTDIRSLDCLETRVQNHDVITIIQAIAGG
jgi:sulfur-carrier protein